MQEHEMTCNCDSCKPDLEASVPDYFQLIRIHYMCPVCLTDIYRDTRQVTVKCFVCERMWATGSFREGTFSNGIEETNPHPERYSVAPCAKHGIKRCKECNKRELYSE